MWTRSDRRSRSRLEDRSLFILRFSGEETRLELELRLTGISSTSQMFIWNEAWSLAALIRSEFSTVVWVVKMESSGSTNKWVQLDALWIDSSKSSMPLKSCDRSLSGSSKPGKEQSSLAFKNGVQLSLETKSSMNKGVQLDALWIDSSELRWT